MKMSVTAMRLTDLSKADSWADVWLEHIIYNPKGAKNNG